MFVSKKVNGPLKSEQLLLVCYEMQGSGSTVAGVDDDEDDEEGEKEKGRK